MTDTPRPCIDVATTSMPRGVTALCMASFLRAFVDRHSFRLRWLFHMCQNPFPGAECMWASTMAEAVDVASWFDDAILIAHRSNVSYGSAVWNLLEKIENPTLWIEDDKLWKKPFVLSEILETEKHFYSFAQMPIGTTSPAYWSPEAVGYLVAKYPSAEHHRKICERTLMAIMRESPITWKDNNLPGGLGHFTDIGRMAHTALEVEHFSAAKHFLSKHGGNPIFTARRTAHQDVFQDDSKGIM